MSSRRVKLPIALIGAGKMAHDCLIALVENDNVDVRLMVTPPSEEISQKRISRYCSTYDIETSVNPDPNSEMVLVRLGELKPEFILNVNSFHILKERIRAIPNGGIINFHNGPLPSYAGVNIPTWVIWNAERRHGVAWHFVDGGIDTGDIILKGDFDVDRRETAASLTFKCMQHGMELFEKLLFSLLIRQVPRERQSGTRTYFSRAEIPNDGYIDFSWGIEKIDRLFRCLDFRPFPNPLGYPRIRFGDRDIRVAAAVCNRSNEKLKDYVGTVEDIDESGISVRVSNGRIILKQILDAEGGTLRPLDAAVVFGLAIGARFN